MKYSVTLLTIGPEYKGNNYLYENAIKSADLFEEVINSKIKCNNIRLRGSLSTAENIINEINKLSLISDDHCKRIIIYYSGHGNHYNNKEYWDTSQGIVDQIKIAKLINKLKPLVIVISDSCSSEHMVNTTFAKHDFISIGATKDNEDAIMTGEGGLFTLELSKIIKNMDENFYISELIENIMICNIEVSSFSVRYSRYEILKERFLPCSEPIQNEK